MLKEEGSLDPPNHHMGVMTDMESTIMERGGTIENRIRENEGNEGMVQQLCDDTHAGFSDRISIA